MQERQALKRLANPERRNRILNEFNRDLMDDVGPIGGDQGMKVLQEMNELAKQLEQIIRDGIPKFNVR